MKSNFTKLFLPIITLAMLLGTNGLSEAVQGLSAETEATEYVPFAGGSDYYKKTTLQDTASRDIGLPNFTFFVPGFGTYQGAWSNNLTYQSNAYDFFCLTGKEDFAFYDGSIINKIQKEHDANVYVMKCDEKNPSKYHLYYYEPITDDNNVIIGYKTYKDSKGKELGLQIENIQRKDQAGKHSIVVYASNDSRQALDQEYANFEKMVNNLCFDFRKKHGYTPKINLIGHSQGGLIAQEYANHYPRNVYSINTIASPFSGSEMGRFLQRLSNYPVVGRIVIEFLKWFKLDFVDHQGFKDFQNTERSNARRDAWNRSYETDYIHATAYGSVLTLPYLVRFLSTLQGTPVIKELLLGVFSRLINTLIEINNIYTSNTSITLNTKSLVNYSSFVADCTPVNVAFVEERLYSAIEPLIKEIVRLTASGVLPLFDVFPFGSLIAGSYIQIQQKRAVADIAKTLAKNICSYQGKVCVLKDDFLVSLDSQVCSGYKRYNRLVRIFHSDYLNDSNHFHATMDMPVIGHNVETMNEQIASSIVGNGMFSNKEDVQEYIVDAGTFSTQYRTGKVRYYPDNDDFVYQNGHGHIWGEFHAIIKISDNVIHPDEWESITVTRIDTSGTDMQFFDKSASPFDEDYIKVTLFVHEDNFEPRGYIDIHYTYKSNLVTNHIGIVREPKTEYYLGEPMDYEGLVVKAVYSNGAIGYLDSDEYYIDSADSAYTNELGQHTIYVKVLEIYDVYGVTTTIEKVASYTINVRVPRLTSIDVDYDNCQTLFYTGDFFNYDGLNVYATYENGDFVQVEDFDIILSNVNMNVAGEYSVDVSYSENGITKTSSYPITVEQTILESISLSGNYPTRFHVGDTFNYIGLIVTAHYTNGSTKNVDLSDCFVASFTLDMNTPGTYRIIVSYGEDSIVKKTYYDVTVTPKPARLDSITLSGNYPTVFAVGDKFSTDGLIVTAHYTDGSSKTVSNYSVDASKVDMNTPGTYTVAVRYSEKLLSVLTTYQIIVKGEAQNYGRLQSISLLGDYQTVFRVGEIFNTDGLIVVAHYADGSSKIITNYMVDIREVDMNTPGKYTVTIGYKEGKTLKTTTYTILVNGKFGLDPIEKQHS